MNAFTRPDWNVELSRARPEPGTGLDAELAQDAIGEARKTRASKALWAAVARAEEQGIRELYGVECIGLADPVYWALVIIRTPKGVVCLRADHEADDERKIDGIPFAEMKADELERVRARVGAHIPFELPVSLASNVDDGALFVVYAYTGDKTHFGLRHEPDPNQGESREEKLAFARDYPILAVIQAIQAGFPKSLLASEDGESDPYETAPGYR